MRAAKALLAAAALGLALAACFPPALTDAELSDSGIRSRIEQSLRARRELDLHLVTLEVHLRVVTVSGIVPTWDDKRKIEKIIRDTPGVEQAMINLVVPE